MPSHYLLSTLRAPVVSSDDGLNFGAAHSTPLRFVRNVIGDVLVVDSRALTAEQAILVADRDRVHLGARQPQGPSRYGGLLRGRLAALCCQADCRHEGMTEGLSMQRQISIK